MKLAAAILPCAIAASGITIAQLHGVGFWIRLFGSAGLGWTVSLMWEAASVWLWWRRDRTWGYRLAKWAATLALVGGMIVQSAAPKLLDAAQSEAGRAALNILAGQSEAGFWVNQKSIMALAERAQLPPALSVGIAWAAVAIMPALYGLAILALVTMAREWNSGVVPKIQSDSAKSANYPEANARALMLAYGKRHGLEYQSQVAKKIDEQPATLSEFANDKLTGEPARRIAAKLKKQ